MTEMTPESARAKALAFGYELAKRRAATVVPTSFGFVVLHPDFPNAHDHNCAVVVRRVDVNVLLSEVDRILGDAGVTHRQVEVDEDEFGREMVSAMEGAGYQYSRELLMAHLPGAQ